MRHLTPIDLRVLAAVLDQPAHGHALAASLADAPADAPAGISRPQVYYTLKKLRGADLVEPIAGGSAGGPERQVFRATPEGRRALAGALADAGGWDAGPPTSPLADWLALADRAPAAARAAVLARRRDHLAGWLAAAPEPAGLQAALQAALVRAELAWLDAQPAPAPPAPAPEDPPPAPARQTGLRRERPAY